MLSYLLSDIDVSLLPSDTDSDTESDYDLQGQEVEESSEDLPNREQFEDDFDNVFAEEIV